MVVAVGVWAQAIVALLRRQAHAALRRVYVFSLAPTQQTNHFASSTIYYWYSCSSLARD